MGALAFSWRDGFIGGAQGPLPLIAGAIGLLGLAGWAERLRRFKFDAIYVGGYMAMLLAWPHPEESSRYGYVIVAFLIAYAVLVLQRLSEKLKSQSAPAWILLIVCLLMLIPGLIINSQRYNRMVPEDLKELRKMVERAMKEQTGADIAWINTGNLRYTLPKGPIQVRDIWNILSFDNSIVMGKSVIRNYLRHLRSTVWKPTGISG